MDNNIRLSIIIPFYNVEQYIAQCLDSVYQQDIAEDEYEVICVNDASPDHSRDIVLEYQKKHSNLVLVEHDVNNKLGAARNTGMKVATGRYIWHVDSDDMIVPNCLKTIVTLCDEKQLDVLEFGYVETNNRSSVILREPVRGTDVLTGQDYIERYYLPNFGTICPVWRRVYRHEFLENNHIISPPINMGEDEAFSVHVFSLAQRVAFEPQDFYVHRINGSSLVGENKKSWSANKWYEASMDCPRYIHSVFQSIKPVIAKDIQYAIQNMIVYDILYFDVFVSDFSQEAWNHYWRLCRKNLIRNRFVIRYLSRKKIIKYLKYIFKFQ